MQKGHEGLVHHILVFQCPNDFPPNNVSHSAACDSPDMPPDILRCQGMSPIGAWAVGGSVSVHSLATTAENRKTPHESNRGLPIYFLFFYISCLLKCNCKNYNDDDDDDDGGGDDDDDDGDGGDDDDGGGDGDDDGDGEGDGGDDDDDDGGGDGDGDDDDDGGGDGDDDGKGDGDGDDGSGGDGDDDGDDDDNGGGGDGGDDDDGVDDGDGGGDGDGDGGDDDDGGCGGMICWFWRICEPRTNAARSYTA